MAESSPRRAREETRIRAVQRGEAGDRPENIVSTGRSSAAFDRFNACRQLSLPYWGVQYPFTRRSLALVVNELFSMRKILKALIQRDRDESIVNTPAVYLLAVGVLLYVIVKEVSGGVVYIKHSGSIELNSAGAYFALGVQVFFLVLAAVICILKVRRNIQSEM